MDVATNLFVPDTPTFPGICLFFAFFVSFVVPKIRQIRTNLPPVWSLDLAR